VEQELQKPMIILVNKSDFLTVKQRRIWHEYFNQLGVFHLFFSAYLEQERIDQALRSHEVEGEGEGVDAEDPYDDNEPIIDDSSSLEEEKNEETDSFNADKNSAVSDDEDERDLYDSNGSDEISQGDPVEDDPSSIITTSRLEDAHGVIVLLNREELLQALHEFAENENLVPNERYGGRIQYGFCGFPNVGKSSVINVLVEASKYRHNSVRVAVAAQPGKTKHFQTLNLPDRNDMMLCDCPGLVFPSFVSSTADLIAAGVYPIAQMRDYWQVVELICQRIPRQVLNAHYAITLPQPSYQDLKEQGLDTDFDGSNKVRIPPPTAEELLGTYCIARSMFAASSGVPDYQRAARVVIKDFTDGKLIYCHPPPSAADQQEGFFVETLSTAFRATKRLRERLCVNTSDPIHDSLLDNGGTSGSLDQLHHTDVLDAAYGLASVDDHPNPKLSATQGKKTSTSKKSGKKNRSSRDKDPYGCHSNIINEFGGLNISTSSSSTSIGVYVNAGKKLGNIPFTRSQPRGIRAAVAVAKS